MNCDTLHFCMLKQTLFKKLHANHQSGIKWNEKQSSVQETSHLPGASSPTRAQEEEADASAKLKMGGHLL